MRPMEQLNGVRKSAILLRSLEPRQAGEILRRLSPDAAARLRQEMGALGDIPSRMRNAVVAEFHQAACSGAIAEVTARGQAIHGDAEAAPFAWLAQTPSDEILAAIRDEHPQMVALVLAHLEPQKAAELLAVLPGVRQIEVVNRVARIGQTSREVIREVER